MEHRETEPGKNPDPDQSRILEKDSRFSAPSERVTVVAEGEQEGQRLDKAAAQLLEVTRSAVQDRKSTRLNSSHSAKSRMPSSA